jgi:hypothetical protein
VTSFQKYDAVVLSRTLAPYGLTAGDQGRVVNMFKNGAVEVEFLDTDGEPYAILTLRPDQVLPASPARPARRQQPAPLPLGIEPTVANATHLDPGFAYELERDSRRSEVPA